MKVTGCETLHCDAGWRDFSFLKVTTDEGVTGISEYNECYGSPGLSGVIERLVAERVVGEDPLAVSRMNAKLYAATRQAPGGMVQQAIAGHRERAPRHQGPGAGRARLGPPRRGGSRPARALLVALRHVPVRRPLPAHRPPADCNPGRSRRARAGRARPRLPRAQDQHLPVRRGRAAPAHAGLHRHLRLARAQRRPGRHRGPSPPARGASRRGRARRRHSPRPQLQFQARGLPPGDPRPSTTSI